MDTYKLAKDLEGMHTVKSASRELGVSRRTAINYISKLRKEGLVKTIYGRGKKRVYKISTTPEKEEGVNLYDVINKHSKVKISAPYRYIVHKKITVEEVIARAVETGRFRLILASLGLFAHVRDWPGLLEAA
ncbi:MAG: leucine zipper domain-containing protein, partial [Candidatus Woesearchaeota archaeon]